MPPDAGELVGNEGVAAIIRELEEQFDYVLVDAPPFLAVSDGVTLSATVDAIFAVTRLALVPRPLLHDLARQLEMVAAEKLGFVLAGAELEEGYGYGYGYGYYDYAPSQAERGKQHVP
jgi:Mrp family chromosome partitioning ATPase